MSETKHSHWSAFWATGALTSLPQDFRSNYDGEVAQFWRRQFDRLPDGTRLLDVCAGNGALSLLACDYAAREGRRFHVTALDAARVDTARIAKAWPEMATHLPAIHFMDGVALESVELPDAGFDFVMSQYGIEYCDWVPAARQLARTLSPGGLFSMVAHAADSDMLTMMRREKSDYERLQAVGLLLTIKAWLAGQISTGRFRRRMRDVQQTLLNEIAKRDSELLQSALQPVRVALASDRYAIKAQEKQFRQYLREMHFGRLRLLDFLAVNESIAANPEWYRTFADMGLELEDSGEILYRGQHRAGHFYCFRRPA